MAGKKKCSRVEEEVLNDLEEVEQGTKHDTGKLRYDLDNIPATRQRVEVLTHGAEKYGDRNWENGINYSRVYAALQRHLTAFWGGESYDQESGLHHLAHASCELMFLQAFEADKDVYIEFDDRPVILEEQL